MIKYTNIKTINNWNKIITLVVITALLFQNIVWANDYSFTTHKLASESNFKRIEEYLNNQEDVSFDFNDKLVLMGILIGLNEVAEASREDILAKIRKLNEGIENSKISIGENLYDTNLFKNKGKILTAIVNVNGKPWRKIYLNWRKLNDEQQLEIGIEDKHKKWLDIPGTENVFIAKFKNNNDEVSIPDLLESGAYEVLKKVFIDSVKQTNGDYFKLINIILKLLNVERANYIHLRNFISYLEQDESIRNGDEYTDDVPLVFRNLWYSFRVIFCMAVIEEFIEYKGLSDYDKIDKYELIGYATVFKGYPQFYDDLKGIGWERSEDIFLGSFGKDIFAVENVAGIRQVFEKERDSSHDPFIVKASGGVINIIDILMYILRQRYECKFNVNVTSIILSLLEKMIDYDNFSELEYKLRSVLEKINILVGYLGLSTGKEIRSDIPIEDALKELCEHDQFTVHIIDGLRNLIELIMLPQRDRVDRTSEKGQVVSEIIEDLKSGPIVRKFTSKGDRELEEIADVHHERVIPESDEFRELRMALTDLYNMDLQPSTVKVSKIKREIDAMALRRKVIYAESEYAQRLLELNNANALLLSSGKYLVTKGAVEEDLKLLRAIIHEDIEALMQMIAEDDRYRYQGIKELILSQKKVLETYYNLFPDDKKSDLSADLLLNDIIARAFELIFLLEEEMIVKDILSQQEIAFAESIKPIIMGNKHNYFTCEFWDSGIRAEKIRAALNKGMRFYQTASLEDDESKKPRKLDLAISRKQKLAHVKAINEELLGARKLDTTSEYFRTATIYNYHYRSGSFRSPYGYYHQIERLKRPDLFRDLLSFVKNLSEDEKLYRLYSVMNRNGSLGLGLCNSILEGDPLVTTSRNDMFDNYWFTIYVGHELFEYVTRRNCAGDLPDVDLFLISELIWQDILRYYFREGDSEIVSKIKEYIEPEAEEERKFQKGLSPLAREALNTSSGWDQELGNDEICIRALARKLSEQQSNAWTQYVGWREIGQALFSDVLLETISTNLQLGTTIPERLSLESATGRILNPDSLLSSGSESDERKYPDAIAQAILDEAVDRGLLIRAEESTYRLPAGEDPKISVQPLTEEDKILFRYLLCLGGLTKSSAVERQYRLIGSHVPEPIGRAVGFLEVAFFPPVGAEFSSSTAEGFTTDESTGAHGTFGATVYAFCPNVSFSFRVRQRSPDDYEVTITPMDDPHKSPIATVRIPKDASFEETLIRVIMALPEQPKALFCNTSIKGFAALADLLCKIPEQSHAGILRRFADYISLHTQQGAFDESLPLGTGDIPFHVLVHELAFLVQDPNRHESALAALNSLYKFLSRDTEIARLVKNVLEGRVPGIVDRIRLLEGPKEKKPPVGSPANIFRVLSKETEPKTAAAIAGLKGVNMAESTIRDKDLRTLRKLGLVRKIGVGSDATYQVASLDDTEKEVIQEILDKEYMKVTEGYKNFNRVYARVVIERLLNTIRTKARSCKDLDEELVLAIDTDIGELNLFAQELFEALNKLQDALAKEGLDNVRIFIGNGKEIETQLGKYLAEKGDKKDYVISTVVKNKNIVENNLFKGIKDRMQITAVDDKNLENTDNDKLNYIPILSILELSIKKAMGASSNIIREEYSNIPNVEEILEQNGMLIIYLLPKAKPIPINELRERYKYEAQVLTSV